MWVDALLLVSDAQAVTADAASTNTIDLGGTNKMIGDGEPLAMAFTIDVGADFTTTDETYTFQIIQSAAANLGTPDVLAARTVSAASLGLAAGTKTSIGLPFGTPTKRYLGAFYDVGGTTPTITVTAFLGPQKFLERMFYYPGVF